ncbi:LacI family DNA-binding transcriptional regulator [Levilactobacillus humaensis]|uniref:LacI family DNA-binding transcriptional regulator n=1 Tax=Levilactobacillus humaensis TaxID=2950375 RepID=UPI0021C272B7|nr:LacI family DNA-binding transcriptional regulator [Levilactobacillus humaensis]
MVKKVTITDIAKAAGISPTTVSLILNGKGERFSQETCSRVFQLRDELGYHIEKRPVVPRYAKKIYRLGVVMTAFNQFFYQDVLAGIRESAGTEVIVSLYEVGDTYEDNLRDLKGLFREPIDGLILCEPVVPAKILRELSAAFKVPYVVINSHAAVSDSDVWVDLHEVGVLSAEYLLANGHRKMAVVVPQGNHANSEIIAGFREGLAEYHLQLEEQDIFRIVPSLAESYRFAKTTNLQDYTAVFTAADEIAIGMMRGLASKGQRVPDTQSLLGVGNSELDNYTHPQLSSVLIPASDIGRAAFDKLEELNQKPQTPRGTLNLPIGLVKRSSVKHI